MNAKKILFPTDFSHLSDAVLNHAAVLAKESGATLLVVHVEEPPMVYGEGAMYYGLPEPDQAALMTMLERIRPKVDVPVEHRLLFGDPAGEIVQLADEEAVDMIVMSTHGRTGFMRLLMGSVAEAVIRRAKCPVLTMKAPENEPAQAE